jgi:predicted TIM-barrel fold metal-dependent hydrolase
VAAIIDADMHLYEGRTTWLEYTPRAQQELALRISDDALGHAWLTLGDRRVHLAEVHHTGEVAKMGEYRRRVRDGLPPLVAYDDELPREFADPAARRDQLDAMGLDGSVVFPNYGLLWERPLSGDLDATRINMSAWNRYAVAVAEEGRGRLYPVGHVTLRDVEWLRSELQQLVRGGVRLAMVAPALVDGKRLSHPDLDIAWRAFEDSGVTPIFHVAAFPRPFDDAWYQNDPDEVTPVLSSSFLSTAPALAIADMAVNGCFMRHAELRLGVMELTARWVPLFLRHLDGAFNFHAAFEGRRLCELEHAPSEYVLRHVRVAAFADEDPAGLAAECGASVFMFCSDYPHAEGTADPLGHYADAGAAVTGDDRDRLYGGNVAWLLHQDS